MRRRYGRDISANDQRKLNEVLEYFNMDAKRRNVLFYDMAMDYLDNRLNWSRRGKEQLRQWKLFWAWFEMKWNQFDLYLLDSGTMYDHNRSSTDYRILHEEAMSMPLPNTFWKELNRSLKGASISRTNKENA